jgi:RNA methyltransferase, TrmH family
MSRSLFTLVRDLKRPRGRERRELALAEGVRLLEEALAASVAIKHVLVSPALEATPRGQALKAALEQGGRPIETVSDKELGELAATDHPQGVVAVIEPPRWTLSDIRPGVRAPVLVLDAVQDPGNVGTMVRTAWALGAAGVIALPGTAEVSNPKTLRATMGGLFRLPYVEVDESGLEAWSLASRVPVLVAAADGAPPEQRRGGVVAIVVGNEGAGTRPSLDRWTAGRIGIPLLAGVESLNVSVAAGILLYEVTRE